MVDGNDPSQAFSEMIEEISPNKTNFRHRCIVLDPVGIIMDR
jgi:hypothetical protein